MLVVNTNRYPLGAGILYHRASPSDPWVSMGPTIDDTTFRVRQTKRMPDLTGVRGNVKGLTRIVEEIGELECRIPELSAEHMGIIVPGTTSTVASTAPVDTSSSPFSSDLALASLANATNIKPTAITNATVGDLIRVGSGETLEVVRIVTVGTAGSAGTGIEVAPPLANAHDLADPVVEVDGTVLAAPTVAGSDNLKVVAVTGLSVGDFVRVGSGETAEHRQILTLGTAGAGGTGITLVGRLVNPHASGDHVVQTAGDGRTTITGANNLVIPDSAYRYYRLVQESLGGIYEFQLDNALNVSDTAEFESGDDTDTAPQITLQAHYDPAATAVPPWRMITP